MTDIPGRGDSSAAETAPSARLVSLGDVRTAAERIRGGVHRTPISSSRSISERAHCRVSFKLECLQRTGSFKIRGALNRLFSLPAEEARRGIVTVSAGNHAQAVACAAAAIGARAVVVMPAKAAPTKIDATKGYGAEIVLHDDVATLFDRAEEIRAREGLVFVHAFDDPAIIAGAGTVGLEMAEDDPDVDAVLVGVGGGGLVSGVAVALKALRPSVRVIGVEPKGAPKMHRSLLEGKAISIGRPSTIADGLAAPFAGKLTFEHVRALVDGVVLVSDDDIVAAMKLLLERMKLLVEPAGAAPLAALLAGSIPHLEGKRVAVVLSGGNADLGRLGEWLRGGGAPRAG